MYIEAKIIRDGKFRVIHFPSLEISTQALKDAEIATMAISLLNDTMDIDLGLSVVSQGPESIRLHATDTRGFLALVISCRRQALGMTQSQLAAKIGAKSATAVARYEQGKTSPSLEVLEKLLAAVGAEIDFLAPALQEA